MSPYPRQAGCVVRRRTALYNETNLQERRTSAMAELWDAYLANGEKAGRLLAREAPVPAGLFHIICDVWVKHTDGSYLVTQRDYGKAVYPGQFEAGASGCAVAGETPYQGALRELAEETGIRAETLTFLFAASDRKNVLFFGYLCLTDCGKRSIRLQAGETIAYQWMDEADFLAFIQTPAFVGPQRERWRPYLDAVRAFGA